MAKEEKPMIAFLLSFSAGILMLINTLLIGINKEPILLSTAPVSSPETLNSTASSWARISFGFQVWIDGLWIPVMLIFASIIIYCSIMLYVKPIQRKSLCLLILPLSLLGLLSGGGFIIGSVLGVIGGAIGFEWPMPSGKTFFGRILRALRLDASLYDTLGEDRHALRQAVNVIVFVNILSGLGCGLYSLTVEKLANAASLDTSYRVLMLGEPVLQLVVLAPVVINIGLAVLKWITLSLIFYVLGVLVMGKKATFERIATAVAFAYVPISLQFFMPFILTSRSYMTFTWPFAVFVITNVWMIFALFVAVRQVLEIPLWKAIGATSLTGAVYLLANQEFFMKLDIPYSIRFFFEPQPVFLMAVTCLIVAATILGTFTKH